jgi:hypothetical protein
MCWDSGGGGQIDSDNQSEYAAAAPPYLRLTRDMATSYTGYNSDGTTSTSLGSATVPGAATTQYASFSPRPAESSRPASVTSPVVTTTR